MAEQSRVTHILIIRSRTKAVLGALSLGGFNTFDGTETTKVLPSGKTVNISKYTPNSANSDGRNAKWFMAMLVDETAFASKSYEGYADFVPLNDMLDSTQYVAASGLPNRVSVTPGTVQDVLSNKSFRYT